MTILRTLLLFVCLPLLVFATTAKIPHSSMPYDKVVQYISNNWPALTRDIANCGTYQDDKMSGKSVLNFPAHYTIPDKVTEAQKKCAIKIAYLPKSIVKNVRLGQHPSNEDGLLYLPCPYIVPGGMFNEMYGWDSYFIIRGLIEDQHIELAKGMVENFFFEIEHYGSILNGNRVYYLSRSQPPFLSSMVLSVYHALKLNHQQKIAWLQNAYQYIIKDYQFWTKSPHLAGNTHLSRYFDFNDGPVVETPNEINQYYKNAISYFLKHPQLRREFLAYKNQSSLYGPLYHLENQAAPIGLTKKFYQGDRAIRESGMDISFRFGPYGANTTDYAPLDLNSLLYKTEHDLEFICKELGKPKEAQYWHAQFTERGKRINTYFWNAKKGLFYDFNFRHNQQSTYNFITTFYPLWIGLATKEQAAAIIKNLKLFEHKGGLVTSTYQSGAQWDYPYGWAPFHLIALEGLRKYGYHQEADRISRAFLSNISQNFARDHTIREKYNVVTSSSNTKINIGYNSNEIGFGWTNGVFLVLLHQLNRHE